jgi:hypothetical protein
MLLAAYGFVARYGTGVFYQDDWIFVPVLSGAEPLTPAWLWKQNNEHRQPLSNLVIVTLYKLSGSDARAGMYFTVTALGAASLVMIGAARALRGRFAYSDAVFPVVLLNWAAYDNFLLGHQVFQALPVLLAGTLLCLAVTRGRRRPVAATLLAGILLLLLPLCGSMGVVFAPPLAGWLLAVTWAPWLLRLLAPGRLPTSTSGADDRRCRWIALPFVVAALGLSALYFAGFENTYTVDGEPFSYHPPSLGIQATLRTAAKFLTVAFGATAQPFWPLSGWVMAGLLLVTAAAVAWLWLARPAARGRVFGVFCFLVALAGLAVGIGVGRAAMGPDMGFSSRYVSLAALLLCCVYLAWQIVGGRAGRLVQMTVFTLACASLAANWRAGAGWGEVYHRRLVSLEEDIRAGTPPLVLAAEYSVGELTTRPVVYSSRILSGSESLADEFATLLRMAAKTRAGVWRYLQDPPLAERPFAFDQPAAVNQVEWSAEGVARCTGNDPHLVYRLPRPEWVYAVRVEYGMENAMPPAEFEAYWRSGDGEPFSEAGRHFRADLPVEGEERLLVERRWKGSESGAQVWTKSRDGRPVDRFWVTVPVNARIDQFRIDPDNKPCVFRIFQVRLVTRPAEEETAQEQKANAGG